MSPDPAANERWRLDLTSHILFAPDSADGPLDGIHFWRTSYQHELAHWVRWQSSSIGLIVTLLRRARAVTALIALERLTLRGRQRVVDIVKQRPLWSYGTGYEPMLFDESFGLSGQMWLDMQFLGQTLLDSSTGVSADWPADAAAGPALSDAWRAAESFLPMAPHVGNEIADQLFTELPSAALGSGFRPDPRLTTRAIWESACTLDELDVEAPDRAHDRNDHRRLVDIKIKSDAYGLALRVAANLAGSLSSPLFRLITWLATDPPVPFLTPFGGEIRWSAFHPPYRFMRLYSAVRDHRRFRKFPFAADLYEFSDDLLQAAGLERANWPTTPVTNPLLTREGDRNVAVHDWAADYELHPGSSQKHAGSLNMLAKASLALRAAYVDAPRSFVYPKIDTLYFSVKDYDSWVFDTQAAHSLLQPFALDFKDGLHSGGFFPDGDLARLSKTHLTNYVTSLLFRESLEALIRGTTARRNHLPREFREWGLGQATPIEQLLLGNYVVEIDW